MSEIEKLVDDQWKKMYGSELALDEEGRLKRLKMLFSALECAESNVKILNTAYCKLDAETRSFRFPPPKKPPTTITDLQQAKKKLDADITVIVQHFQKETECLVEAIVPGERPANINPKGVILLSSFWTAKVMLR